MSYIGALHTYTYSLIIALVFFIALMYKNKTFKELKNKGESAQQTLLKVNFTEVKESNGFTYQGLLDIKIVPEK